MTLQTTAVTGVNTNIKPVVKTSAGPVEKIKETYNAMEDGEKKVYTALSGLAVLSLAGLGIALKIKKNKPLILPSAGDSGRALKTVQRNASNALKKMPKTINSKKDVNKAAKKASEEILGGANYAKVKQDATKNLDKSGKKVVKEKMANVRAGLLKKDSAKRKELYDASEGISASIGDIKNAGQGIKSAVSSDEVNLRVQTAQNAAVGAQNKANTIKEITKNNPTRKNIKRAKAAENRAIKAGLRADKIHISGEKRISEIALDTKRKEENIRRTIESSSPERLLEGQRKMEANAAKTTERAIRRRAKREMSAPGYKRALEKFQGYSKEKLLSVTASTKTSNVEKTVARDLLGV